MKALCQGVKNFGPVIGRVLLSNLFIVSGLKKMSGDGFAHTAVYMSAKMPALDPNLVKFMLVVTIAIEVGGGVMVLIGWQARWAATALLLWMIPVTLLFHAYWGVPPEQVQMQFIQFQKNLAIMGALLLLAAFGPGKYCLGKSDC